MNEFHFQRGYLMFNRPLTNIYRFFLIFLSAIGASQTTIASPVLQEFNVIYSFTRNGMNVGEVKRTLRTSSDGRYTFESVSEATGFISLFIRDRIIERSTWSYVNDKPRPLNYVYKRNGGKKDRHVKLSFNWKKGVVTNTINNDPWQMPIPPGTQDKLLYQLTLMIDLKAGKEKLHYDIADGGMLKDYEFTVMGMEPVDTPMGKFETIKIQRVDDKRNTTIWCAKSLDYLPVRIEQEDKDDSLAMLIRNVTGLPAASASTSTVNVPE